MSLRPRRSLAPVVVLAAVVLASCRKEHVDAYGNFEATEVTVAAEVGGRLLAFGLEEGDRIARDSVVGVIDTVPLVLERQALAARRAAAAARTRESDANIAALEVQATIAERDLARTERLLKQAAATAQQGDRAERDARVAREQLAGARAAKGSAHQEVAALDAQLASIDDKLARGVLAYGEGRDAEALELLSGIDARALDATLAGHIALAQAELTAKKDPKKALDFLDDARLLAPGTLVEEAALRRQVSIVAASGEFDQFELLSANYLRRFSRSVYADAFRRQFATDVAVRPDTGDSEHTARLQAALEALEPVERRDVYLSIAREALIRGKVPLARFAAVNAASLFEEPSAGRLQSGLYEAAALVLTKDIDKGVSKLGAVDKAKLGEEDAELAAAAGAVAAEITRMPSIADAAASANAGDLAKTFKVVGTARETMERADQLLSGATR
jgi:chemotaxis protein MotC